MNGFTKGEWRYKECIPEGITLNSKEYLIRDGDTDIALVRKEEDARIIARAPEMYELLKAFWELDRDSFIHPVHRERYMRYQKIHSLIKYIERQAAQE